MRKLTQQQQQQADTSVPDDEDEGDEKVEVKVRCPTYHVAFSPSIFYAHHLIPVSPCSA